MKNFGRKMLGLILAIAMVCSILPVAVMATPTTDGYALKFEYADNTAAHGFSQERTNAVFSGGSANQAVAGTTEYYIDFMADISKAGDYTIWVRGGQHGSGWASNIKITVDGETVLPELGNTTGSFWANSYGINHQMAFQSTTATFTAGSHTIRYELDGVAPNNTSYYLGAFDCMVIMPTNYTWTPAIDTMPTAPTLKEFDEDGYGWFEETDYSTKHGYFNQNLSNAAYSGGKALAVNQADYADNYLDFYINVPKAGTYDIWVNGTSTNNWASAPKLLLNGEEQTLTSMSGEIWNGNYVSQWKKVSAVSLPAGEVDIQYLLNVSRASGATNYIGVFDVMCIVPTSWGWTQSITERPAPPALKQFDEDGYGWFEETDYSEKHGYFNQNLSHSSYSGGSALGVNQTDYADNYLDFYINVPKADTYDIWVNGTSTNNWASAPKLLLNGEEQTLTSMSGEIWNGNYVSQWKKVSAVSLPAGEVDIQYLLNVSRASGATNYIGVFDVMCIVPTSWGWTQSITERPAPPALKQFDEDGYGWFEETDYSAKHGYFDQNLSNAAYSGGEALAVNQASYADNYLDFYIDVPETGTYDIWVHGPSDNTWASRPKILINGEQQTTTFIGGDEWGNPYVWKWQKISGVSLTAGEVDIRFLVNESRASGATNYIAVFDMMCIVPTLWGWSQSITERPVKPAYVTNAWIEGEKVSGSNTPSGQRSMDAYHGGKAQVVNTASAPGVDGYYFDYSVFLQAGTYDIYFRGSDDAFSEWMSNATAYVDGTEKSYTSVLSEGWDASGGFAYGWLKVSGVELTRDAHSIRWAYKEPRAKDNVQYIGDLDCIAIVPSGTQFTPIKNNNANTKSDYYISLLLSDYNLSNVTESLTLSPTLENGSAVTWSSNNTDVIANDGTFTKPYGDDLVVNLTATAEEYTKIFEAKVFAIPVYSRSAWIEGESAESGFTQKPSRDELSGGRTYLLAANTAPSNAEEGYRADYSVNLAEGAYDIYFRGVDDAFGLAGAGKSWMSDAHTYVNGVEKPYENVMNEGWGSAFSSKIDNYAYGWFKVSGVELTEAKHTISLAYLETATANPQYYFGGLDCIVIVPAGAPFEPKRNDVAETKADFYKSSLLADYDLTNVTDNIALPTSFDGAAVAWASNKSDIISNNGTVSRPVGDDVVVKLTASFGTTEKVFSVTVKGLDKYVVTDFAIGGSCTAGGTVTATVNVRCNGNESGQASLILAVYKDDGKLGDMIAADMVEQVVSSTPTTFNCSVAIEPGQEGTLFARAFLWNDFTDLKPLVDGI